MTYIHAESFSSGEIKHGPLALIESGKENHSKGMTIEIFSPIIIKK